MKINRLTFTLAAAMIFAAGTANACPWKDKDTVASMSTPAVSLDSYKGTQKLVDAELETTEENLTTPLKPE